MSPGNAHGRCNKWLPTCTHYQLIYSNQNFMALYRASASAVKFPCSYFVKFSLLMRSCLFFNYSEKHTTPKCFHLNVTNCLRSTFISNYFLLYILLLFVCLFVCLSIYLSIHLFIFLYICLFIYLFDPFFRYLQDNLLEHIDPGSLVYFSNLMTL